MGRDFRIYIGYGMDITQYYEDNCESTNYMESKVYINGKLFENESNIKFKQTTFSNYILLPNYLTFKNQDSLIDFCLKFNEEYIKLNSEENKKVISEFCKKYRIPNNASIIEIFHDY